MIRYWSIPLMCLLLVQVLYLPVLSVWLHCQQDYIASELCENRFTPELMCAGKCYVQEVTAEAIGQEQQEGQATVTEDVRPSFPPFLPAHCRLSVERALPALHALPPAPELQTALLASGVFHPPRA